MATVTCDGDTYVDSNSPTSNFNTSNICDVTGSPERIPLLKFTLPSLGGGTLTAADFTFYTENNGSAIAYPVYVSSVVSYDVDTVTWNTRPTLSGTQVGSITPNATYTQFVCSLDTSALSPFMGSQVTLYAQNTGITDGWNIQSTATANPPVMNVTVSAPPSQATVTCDADTYVHSLNTTSNYGSAWTMQCLGSPQVVPMMKFTLPSGTPTAATLTLWTDSDASTGTYDVRIISDVSWNESTVTWASGKPTFNGPSIGQVTPSATVTEYEITLNTATLTSYMGSQVTIYLDGSSTNGCKFRSTENGTSAHHPVMDVTVSDAIPAAPQAITASSSIPTPTITTNTVVPGWSTLIDGARHVTAVYDGTRAISRIYNGPTLIWDAEVGGTAPPPTPLWKPPSASILSQWDLETPDLGPVTTSELVAMHTGSGASVITGTYAESRNARCQVVASPDGVGRALRMTHLANGVGEDYAPPGWYLQVATATRELYLSYKLWFGAGMDFGPSKPSYSGWGGKLPGLGGANTTGTAGAYCVDATGDKWSVRGMWRQPTWEYCGSPGGVPPMLDYVYAYAGNFAQGAQPCGIDACWQTPYAPTGLVAERWYHVQRRVLLNQGAGTNDGELQSWLMVDGVPQQVNYRTGIGFISHAWSSDYQVMMFESYIGGATAEWNHSTDEHFYYKDLVLSTSPWELQT